ncbi:RE1-silencing transcription factor isoform X2 [Sphaeramia orbicularis]|uniref:RE1-silencing transcription factor isoform X2 n=1 Tax=Sphaeramia orbicularis TaxID=375764 RepID=UPI00117D261C|nr:RE1-silencing transcription factor isoform X2 [Sphaeramia orbicularis]
MAAQTVFSVEVFPVGVSLMDDAPSLNDMPRNTLPAPQLVMLANVAAVTAAESIVCDSGVTDEKEMMELKTVGCNYSDSEDENIISYDNQNHREVCIIEYPESPGFQTVVVGQQEDDHGDKIEDLSQNSNLCPAAGGSSPQQGVKRKESPASTAPPEGAKKKKPFHCKPCHFQAQNEQEFVQHLSTHAVSKMMVVNKVEGRSKTKAKEAEPSDTQTPPGRVGAEAESSGEAGPAGDSKGLIRCERCGYNTNRYDHYIAHLKHHSKEGEDHRVFKCTLCPYTTVSQYHWRKHLRNHFPSKLHTCSQCSYFSDRKSNYIQHIRTHTGVRPFQCPYCDYSSSQKTHLTRHMRTHSGERPFKCESCNYLAANQHEVTRHARQVHNGPKPLACPYCDYKTADRSNFKKHVELHLNPRQFLCPLCKYAASKKCNLQYHIKSRHSGCNVALDVSKVKLRIKKLGPEGADDKSESQGSKLEQSSGMEEDFDMDDVDDDDESVEKQASPINLSIRKSSRPNVQLDQNEMPQRKTSSEKQPKGKEEAEKKVSRQKKMEKVSERSSENTAVKLNQSEIKPAATQTDHKVKRRVKKPPAEKTSALEQTEGNEPEQDRAEIGKPEKHEQRKPEKNRAEQQKDNEVESPLKKDVNNLNKPRKSGSKKSDKTTEHIKEAPQKPDSPAKVQKEKVVKEKAAKRKAGEALDLSKKSETPSKTRRLKAATAKKNPPSKDTEMTIESTSVPVKQKKTRNTSKKAPVQQQVEARVEEETPSVEATGPLNSEDLEESGQSGDPKPDHEEIEIPPSEPDLTLNKLEENVKVPSNQTPSPEPDPTLKKPSEYVKVSDDRILQPEPDQILTKPSDKVRGSGNKTPRPEPNQILNKPSDKVRGSGSKTPRPEPDQILNKPSDKVRGSGKQTPRPELGQILNSSPEKVKGSSNQTSPRTPVFAKPMSPPPLVLPRQQSKPMELEDDEGIHSSHEGGSDISDSASEGSDDSGLNSTGSGKMSNDPETPTDEPPTPTELKSHMCVFCDRTFPLKTEYQRHLNRHLVNVYYMDNTATKAQK